MTNFEKLQLKCSLIGDMKVHWRLGPGRDHSHRDRIQVSIYRDVYCVAIGSGACANEAAKHADYSLNRYLETQAAIANKTPYPS